MSGEQEMLTSGTRDEEEPESARLSYDESSSAEAKATTGSVARSISRQHAVVVDAQTADALRWFVFPSEGAGLLRKALRLSTPREAPRASS